MATAVLGGVSVLVFLLTHDLARMLPFARWSLRDSAFQGYATYGPYVSEFHEAWRLVTGAFLQTDWWRLVTGAFLHADLRHLLLNMVVLYLLGRRLEQSVGPALLAGAYAVSLLGGSAGALLHRPDAAVVGASGAVYGLMGAAYVVEHLRGANPWRDGLGSLIIINVIISFLLPGISIGGHLGGLATGVLAGFAIGDTSRRRHPPTLADRLSNEPIDTGMRRSPLVVWVLLALIAAAAFASALAAASTWRDPLF
ncbi:MAG: rhomboid family intramembrane serine protease [Acidimicrobiaceae bacterium]|uniref:rhomboid family intramembrane serine protease n=1 Tax=Candidatus Poriferisodalis multihospitum TaxID=2983191 RepID=UPI0023A408BC|nr:rhomboid family intramembrane serine protease [Candidatus Poriferisodalis multihospitum]MDE0135819.1 rhomboid family intramembrane serine protease [Acidimicrobiaceae bacterium]MDE0498761.1 rhomboid family intramembrane serine protease [Acidimicrobiaceae bacterium]